MPVNCKTAARLLSDARAGTSQQDGQGRHALRQGSSAGRSSSLGSSVDVSSSAAFGCSASLAFSSVMGVASMVIDCHCLSSGIRNVN